MVNQTDRQMAAIHRDATHDVARVRPTVHILQRTAVHDGEILHLQPHDGVERIDHIPTGFRQRVVRGKALALGLNIVCGKITYKAVADVWQMPYEPIAL